VNLLYVFPEPLPLPRARGIQTVNTVAALARHGARVTLAHVPVAAAPDPFDAYGVPRDARIRDIPISRGWPWPLNRLRAGSNRLFFGRLARWIRGQRHQGNGPDVIMARHLKIAHALLTQFPDIPLVYEAHEVFADVAPEHKRTRLAELERAVLTQARGLIAITAAAADDLRKRYALERPVHVLHDAVEMPPSLPAKPWNEAGRHIVYAGSFFPWKGVDDLVEAATKLPGLRLTLMGGTQAHIDRFRGIAKPAGAEIEFLGHLPHAEVMQALARACIGVLPNRADPNSMWSSPLKLFEYMACGLAIVASDLPSLREVLGADDAVWVAPGDPVALAAALQRLAADPSLAQQLGARARELARHYTWDERARSLLAMIREDCPGVS